MADVQSYRVSDLLQCTISMLHCERYRSAIPGMETGFSAGESSANSYLCS